MNPRVYTLLLSIFFTLITWTAKAQCAMCNATAESSLDSGSTAAKGLNTGVLFLLAMPFLFASVFVFLYFKRKRDLEKLGIEDNI